MIKHVKNFIITLICLFLVFYNGADLTKNEVRDLGGGASIYHNLHSDRKFAILYPPLSGIMSFMSVKYFLNFDISYLKVEPSGNYDDLISYMYALKTPQVLGESIIENLKKQYSTYHIAVIMRTKNFLFVFLILLYLAYKNIPITIILAAVLSYLNITNSTSEIINAFLIVLTLIIMNSILYDKTKPKFVLLGIVLGGCIASYGFKGLILCGASICSSIINYDFQNKIKSRGFKLVWVINTLISIIIAFIVTWIIYGMDLACICQFESLLGLQNTFNKTILNWKIVPFFDTFKQSVFEIIFSDTDNQQSFIKSLLTFFTFQNIILTLFAIESTIKRTNPYSILLCFIVLIAVVLHANGEMLFKSISITMVILCSMVFVYLLENNQLKSGT